jgi:hypothetical protein
MLSFELAVAELAVTRARPLYPHYGRRWPNDLAQVAADRLEENRIGRPRLAAPAGERIEHPIDLPRRGKHLTTTLTRRKGAC